MIVVLVVVVFTFGFSLSFLMKPFNELDYYEIKASDLPPKDERPYHWDSIRRVRIYD
jgi:hypothetical protein